MYITLSDIEREPDRYSKTLLTSTGEVLLFRPLLRTDIGKLTIFLENLSSETRKLSTFDSYDKATATDLCKAINKYDKLRFVLESDCHEIVGLIEYTLDIPQNVLETYASHNVIINTENTCRFGPTLADEYQSKGVGSSLFPYILEIVKLLGKTNIILYGGVLADNSRAIKYYEKHGFKQVGKFKDDKGIESIDMMLKI